MRGTVDIRWCQRERALEPTAALARGVAAPELARRLLARDDDDLSSLRGLATADALIIVGAAGSLPWVDRVEYLGRDPRAPGPLWPTAVEPTAPPALVARALERRCSAPFAVVPPSGSTAGWLLSLARVRPLHRAALASWLDRATGATGSDE